MSAESATSTGNDRYDGMTTDQLRQILVNETQRADRASALAAERTKTIANLEAELDRLNRGDTKSSSADRKIAERTPNEGIAGMFRRHGLKLNMKPNEWEMYAFVDEAHDSQMTGDK